MSAHLQPVPERLRVTAIDNHKTITYDGDIFAFIQMLIDEGWTGEGTFRVNQGKNFYGLQFDLREKVERNKLTRAANKP